MSFSYSQTAIWSFLMSLWQPLENAMNSMVSFFTYDLSGTFVGRFLDFLGFPTNMFELVLFEGLIVFCMTYLGRFLRTLIF